MHFNNSLFVKCWEKQSSTILYRFWNVLESGFSSLSVVAIRC
uniref:Uncharacterized protein n=1 Tax=Anguilla anguilla TaxID=7936 RepID=A0A0E9TKC4_ANGAN